MDIVRGLGETLPCLVTMRCAARVSAVVERQRARAHHGNDGGSVRVPTEACAGRNDRPGDDHVGLVGLDRVRLSDARGAEHLLADLVTVCSYGNSSDREYTEDGGDDEPTLHDDFLVVEMNTCGSVVSRTLRALSCH